MNLRGLIAKVIKPVTLVSMVALSTSVFASGFQLFEYNGISTGDFNAGGAAIADDASTAFANPAGMTRLKHAEILASLVGVFPENKFEGETIWRAAGTSPTSNLLNNNVCPRPGSGCTQSGISRFNVNGLIPAFHLVAPLTDDVAVGLSVSGPFGLTTRYSDHSFMRYAATRSKIVDIDISPNVGIQITKQWSFGLGLDFEYIKAHLDSFGGAPPLEFLFRLPRGFLDTKSANEGDGWGYSWHAGVLYQLTPHTRFGVSYHARTEVELDGKSEFSGRLADPNFNNQNPNPRLAKPMTEISNNLTARITLPPTTTFSVYHDLTNRLAVMGSIIYTQWNVFNKVTLTNVAGRNAENEVVRNLKVTVMENYRNTWRFVVGAHYQTTKHTKLLFGLGYDETPTTNEFRDARLPDGRRIALAFGLHYQYSKKLGFQVGWTHLFIKSGRVNSSLITGAQKITTIGEAQNEADLVGGQIVYNFA